MMLEGKLPMVSSRMPHSTVLVQQRNQNTRTNCAGSCVSLAYSTQALLMLSLEQHAILSGNAQCAHGTTIK